MKACPRCDEDLQEDARKNRYCGALFCGATGSVTTLLLARRRTGRGRGAVRTSVEFKVQYIKPTRREGHSETGVWTAGVVALTLAATAAGVLRKRQGSADSSGPNDTDCRAAQSAVLHVHKRATHVVGHSWSVCGRGRCDDRHLPAGGSNGLR